VKSLPMGDRTTIANMAPEYGATCGLFPIDQETLDFLRLTGRDPEQVALVEAYAREQGWFASAERPEPRFSEVLELDISTVVPCLAGPKRPQDRVALAMMKPAFATALAESGRAPGTPVTTGIDGQSCMLHDGSVVIAAITSCTNTSNPSVMLAAGLVAQKAVNRGLRVPPWVKTSLGPGSMVVTRYLEAAGLLAPLKQLGFHVVGYGCTTCIGNSGPLRPEVSQAIAEGQLSVASVLSGNRNFEGRVHAEVRMNYLASPPLVVAYALAGRLDFDPEREPLAHDRAGQPVLLKDLWPAQEEIRALMANALHAQQFRTSYADVFAGDSRWQELAAPAGQRYDWEADSTYIQHPPYFAGMSLTPEPITAIKGARCLAILGDSVTTDHISPAGAIKADSPAGHYLLEQGVPEAEFNSYGSRRGNHQVMMRGTFANLRLRNQMAPGTEGGVTRHQPSDEPLSIYAAAMRYQAEGVPAIIIAGKEYGSGSSRDWAAKGPRLLGVRAVIAESFERIHRTNLVCMGIVPLQFTPGDSAQTLGLTGAESFDLGDFADGNAKQMQVTATGADGSVTSFTVKVRIDTPNEADYYRHGGILHYVLRRLAEA
jgi:aconitate hydratase